MREKNYSADSDAPLDRSRFPSSIFFDAALGNLDGWVRLGIASPHADPILVSGSPPAPLLDEFRLTVDSSRLNTPSRKCRGAHPHTVIAGELFSRR